MRILMLIAIVPLSVTRWGFGDATTRQPSPIASPVPGTPILQMGTVTNIDPVNNAIQLKDRKGILQTVNLDDGIQLMVKEKATTLNDLKLGDVVTIRDVETPETPAK